MGQERKKRLLLGKTKKVWIYEVCVLKSEDIGKVGQISRMGIHG